MTRDEMTDLASDAFAALPQPPAGAAFVLIALDTTTGAFQFRVAHMDVTYLVGLLQRCAFGIDRATHEAHVKNAAVVAEDIKAN